MAPSPIQDLVLRISGLIINPFLALVFGAGFLVFIWGLVVYLYNINWTGKQSDEGKKHMLYGLAGMFIMAAAWGIIRLIANTLNAQLPY